MAAQILKLGKPVGKFTAKKWLNKPETWPVIASITVACGWCAYMSSRHLFTSPDVSLSPARRGSPLKDNSKEAQVWTSSQLHHIAKDVRQIGILNSFERKY